jgi:alcohol dehydrogenase class IV
MAVRPFLFSGTPAIHFGAHCAESLGSVVSAFGGTALWVRGKSSLSHSGAGASITASLKSSSVQIYEWEISGEPSPENVDSARDFFKDRGVDVVLSTGGGSVIDAGKAISGMLREEGSVAEYLEDVGTRKHPGTKVPFVAVPTTAGTGCEATKNAVLSRVGPHGFKKSLRHDNFMPDAAVVDPVLTLSCPSDITAACGLDALTQLLESFVSTKASVLTDVLAQSGLEHLANSLVPACTNSGQDIDIRANLAYAALLSGITLTSAGLGTVHGFASSIGGLFTVPHGVVCGALLGPCLRRTIENLSKNEAGLPFLVKYARAGEILCGRRRDTARKTCDLLMEKIDEFTRILKIQKLGKYGITEAAIDGIVDRTDNKNNPAKLEREELRKIMKESI